MKTLLITFSLSLLISAAVSAAPSAQDADESGIYNTVAKTISNTGKGMTFMTKKSLPRNNQYHQSAITTVGCGISGQDECDAYKGDTDCSVKLPVLCFAPVSSLTDPSNAQLHQWAKGRMKTIGPHRGSDFNELQDVNAACAADLGNPNWRAATFHEHPKGWNWTAFGKAHPQKRFWVHIKDQPANCWQ